MAALLVSHHRPGFYMRVLTEGQIQAGDQIVKITVGPHSLSVADIDALLYLPGRDLAMLRVATQIPALSPGWQQSFHDLLAEADRAGAPSPPVEATWTGFRPLKVTAVVRESERVRSIFLESTDDTPLPAVEAGQYLTLRIPGAGQPAPVRSYSLSSAPRASSYRISVKRENKGVASSYLTSSLQPGAILDVAAPRGEFVLDDGTGPVLFISAGIGITPVLSMLHQLAADNSAREVWWIHGAREPAENPLAAEAHRLLAALPKTHEYVTYSAPAPAERRRGHGATGRITKDTLTALKLPATATAYLCGPASFMSDMQDALTSLGIDRALIHTELFGGRSMINPGLTEQTRPQPHQPPGPAGTGPLVTFARSGIATPFQEDKHSVLDLADACDVPTRWSCRTGVCHTCITRMLSGEVTYSPDPLDPPADGEVLICSARPRTEIILDM
jgi:ferredoxin-NADP reductase